MQNWETSTAAPNYEQHNAWYSSMFAANIKQEPISHHHHQQQQHHNSNSNSGASSPHQSPLPSPNALPSTQLEQYLKQQHLQQQQQPMDTLCAAAMTPSPSNNDQNSLQHFDATLQQQLLQQQQYQQHFQAAQQQQQQQQHHHLSLGGFNPLTPPGLPNPMQHFYASNMRPSPQPTPIAGATAAAAATPSATTTPTTTTATTLAALQAGDKLQALTPPMDVTPPKSPAKSQQSSAELPEKEHDMMSNSSEDMKYMAESEDDDTNIRMPIYNSHGKMKNYKCKTCGVVAITKVDFWAHTRTHMKPDKILQCAKCPFVTEFKHHLEYHIRKHKNQKPFQCDKCSYTCVNKSMLNSHRKSHSSVYQYRCADCDYATKYCHSFKLHLRKYGHKPGMVLDEDGTPNPSLVIDVYGTRRGPKSKSVSGSSSSSAGGGGSSKRSSSAAAPATPQQQQQQQQQPQQQQTPVLPATSQLSAALQGFHMPSNAAAVSQSSPAAALPTVSPPSPAKSVASAEQAHSLPSALLPPLASLLQQNRNMAFFPYWNLNLQMLAAQQQAAVLAQLSPRMHDQLQQQQQQQQQQHQQQQLQLEEEEEEEEEEHEDDFERKSVDSAMDLSQGTPIKEEQQQQPQHQQQQPHSSNMAINLKLKDDDTPLISSSSASRRKGRVLKLDTLLQLKSAAMSTPEQQLKPLPTASSPIAGSGANKQLSYEPCSGTSSADESMETSHVPQANTSASSTASSSGNSSNASSNSNAAVQPATVAASASASASVSSSSSSTGSGNSSAPAIYECKYCDIYFKDAVLYTIHMGYHSCDDVFKCNMCGEKCDGPVGLFVHMARNAHS